MLAARLAEGGRASVLIDRTGDFGPGVAYSTPFAGHLLNVRAGRMSAVEGRPGDFVDWLRANAPDQADPMGFAPRALYGRYVRDRLAGVETAHPGRVRRVTGHVAAITADGVRLANGETITGAAVVLATGNPPPRTAGGDDRVLADPWAPEALDRIGDEDDILIIGSGLTMVDVVQTLDARGWRGRVSTLSMRGLLPRTHGAPPDVHADLPETATAGPLSRRLKAARALARDAGWRAVMDGYRPITARLWVEATTTQRARLMHHLRPWWDVHRHRIAPEMGRMLDRLSAEDRLTLKAGRLESVEAGDGKPVARWRPWRQAAAEPLTADWIIDCTGPGHDAAAHPLTGPLIAQGRARLDPLGLGLDLDADGRVLDAQGRADARLWTLGPPARAAYWETIAVPDIRKRIEAMAEELNP